MLTFPPPQRIQMKKEKKKKYRGVVRGPPLGKQQNHLSMICWKRKLPLIKKKVTKFPHCTNQFQRWGLCRGANYLQGPIENAVLGLWHEEFPPSSLGSRTLQAHVLLSRSIWSLWPGCLVAGDGSSLLSSRMKCLLSQHST